MPVGTQASVKGLTPDQIAATGAEMVLANAYHLAIRPGEQTIRDAGGLHRFMGWDGPILTDSGGFQLVSLARLAKVDDDGVTFRSHVDGAEMRISPERAVEIQESLGADVAMVLDHAVPLPGDPAQIADATERTVRWADRCRRAHRRRGQALFAIVQGGLSPDLRVSCAERLTAMDFPGYAVGGLSVGEPPEQMLQTVEVTVPVLPADRPRYLMGVGRPEDLLNAVARGIDMFDCVMPTRNGRNGVAFTDDGPLRIKNVRFASDRQPLEQHCRCAACRHSLAYLRHLFMAGEMLGPVLLSIHNLTCYQRLLAEARQAIVADRFDTFRRQKTAGWNAPAGLDGKKRPN